MENNTKSFYHSLAHQVLNSILLLDDVTMSTDSKIRVALELLDPQEDVDMLFWVEQAQEYIQEAKAAMERIVKKLEVEEDGHDV